VLYARAVREAAQAAKPDGTVFFTRAGYSGSQRYTTGGFTGDQERSWDRRRGLPSVVTAMLSGSLSGWPYWGPDIAGFMAPTGIRAEKELWIRWVQLGALSPTMRDMLGDAPHPIDLDTDGETLAVFRAYARLHSALEPYLYRAAVLAHQRGLPILRPLFVDYPDEPATYRLDDEYLLGDQLLVAPVLRPGATRRRLYLPTGAWQEYWTGTLRHGPGWVEIDAPLHEIPMLVRGGAALHLPDPATLWI
jgi:alpha-glucosidase (family GH31 glycosyl hydrolase)